ncbi:hypothetical protein P280DRAFT_129563 [Massarina eburnea CBS 473.64]|uniref:Uncharacterized protein n=1 Tax=Massarina eburnea CBS 473.64 TaxID=1395130 RepID=A0A6A6SD35_9PLEO|nr:hypothetical protein P280DRAFT_129563 [Massarina eburnea CBS 473.64]
MVGSREKDQRSLQGFLSHVNPSFVRYFPSSGDGMIRQVPRWNCLSRRCRFAVVGISGPNHLSSTLVPAPAHPQRLHRRHRYSGPRNVLPFLISIGVLHSLAGKGPTRRRNLHPCLTSPELQRLLRGANVLPRVELDRRNRTEAKYIAPEAWTFSLSAVSTRI